MFHKEGSSVLDLKNARKPYKDVTLRKSDRKLLFQAARQFFANDGSKSPESTAPKETCDSILEDIFLCLDANLFQRTCHVPLSWNNETLSVTVHLYFRSPRSSVDLSSWPYTAHAQCIWMQVIVNTQQRWDLPGVALCSVIPLSCYEHRITLIPSPVSEFVCSNGVKHIMRVGIRGVPILPKEKTAPNHHLPFATLVCVQGNPQPFAVGILHPDLIMSSVGQDSPLFGPHGPKGVGVTILHSYGDDIWRHQLPTSKELDQIRTFSSSIALGKSIRRSTFIQNPMGGSFYDAGHYGNVGFEHGKYVHPIHQESAASKPVGSVLGDMNDLHVSQNVTGVESTDLTKNMVPTGEDKETKSVDHDVIKDPESTTIVDVDPQCTAEAILHDAVCRALAALNPKQDLPMTMANFYALHVLPHRMDGTTIQLKHTRYKKFSVYVAEQVQAGLLLVGKLDSGSSKDPMGMLVGFDRRHADLASYISTHKEQVAIVAASGAVGEKRLVIADLYCIPNHFVDILKLDRNTVKALNATSEERRGTGMLTAKEVKAIFEDYVVKEELIPKERPDVVMLNGPLTDVLYKRKNKKDTNASNPSPLSLPRKDILNMWMACQESAYALVQLPGNTVLKLKRGKPPNITVEVSRRQSNKYITTVMGLELFDINAEEFAKDVSNRFACASSTSKLASSSSEAVVLQGNFSIEIEALLLSEERLTQHGGVKGSTYFLPKNSIQVVLKKGVPARKKPK